MIYSFVDHQLQNYQRQTWSTTGVLVFSVLGGNTIFAFGTTLDWKVPPSDGITVLSFRGREMIVNLSGRSCKMTFTRGSFSSMKIDIQDMNLYFFVSLLHKWSNMVLSHEQAVLIAHFELKRISVLRKHSLTIYLVERQKPSATLRWFQTKIWNCFNSIQLLIFETKKLYSIFSLIGICLFLFSLSITMTIVFISDDENDTLQ